MPTSHRERTIRRIVDLERVSEAVEDDEERRRLDAVARGLRRDLGVGVPKRLAAKMLGVSVQALEPWIRSGLLPGVYRPGSSREAVDTETLVVLVHEVSRRRAAGERRAVVASALRELDRTARLPRKLRPNQTPAELRRAFADTTSEDRLRDVAALSSAAVRLAALGRSGRG